MDLDSARDPFPAFSKEREMSASKVESLRAYAELEKAYQDQVEETRTQQRMAEKLATEVSRWEEYTQAYKFRKMEVSQKTQEMYGEVRISNGSCCCVLEGGVGLASRGVLGSLLLLWLFRNKKHVIGTAQAFNRLWGNTTRLGLLKMDKGFQRGFWVSPLCPPQAFSSTSCRQLSEYFNGPQTTLKQISNSP